MTKSSYKKIRIMPLLSGQEPVSRGAIILPTHVGTKVLVHNGKVYYRLNVTQAMIGKKFGSFVFTRKKCVFRSKKGKKKKK